jgi:hypothetical protein
MKTLHNTNIEWIKADTEYLEQLVKKLDYLPGSRDTEVLDKVIVEYDRRLGKASKLEGRRFSLSSLFGMKKPVEYYRVDIYERIGAGFTGTCRITHRKLGMLELSVHCTTAAREGNETDLVETLASRDTPETRLRDKLKTWIEEFIAADESLLFLNFEAFSTGLSENISRASGTAGLITQTSVIFEGQGPRDGKNIRVSVRDAQVQPKGYNDFITMGFDAVLAGDKLAGESVFTAIGFKKQDEFSALMTTWLQEFVRESVSYNEITGNLHSKVRSNLTEYWNRQLRSRHSGWVVAELVLFSSDIPPSSFKYERMEIEVSLRNAKIPLINTIILNLDDAEKFKNARIENLEVWIKEKLQQAAQNVLAKKSYADLVSGISQLASVIKSTLDTMAINIGYRVEYLLTSDLVDGAKLGFDFQFSEDEQSFQTTLNDTVKLNIAVSGKIRSLNYDYWKANLTPQTDFVQVMKKEIIPVVRQLLLKTTADDFYTQFNQVVETTLVKTIKDLLVIQFNVDPSVDISPRIALSPIGILIRNLQEGIQHIDVVCHNKEIASFRISFGIKGVDPSKWGLFATRNYTSPEQVKTAITERVRIFVESTVRLYVTDINVLRDSRFIGLISKYARLSDQVIREKLGLIIDIIDVELLVNTLADNDVKFGFLSAKKKKEMLQEAIQKADTQLFLAKMNEDDQDELDELQKKLTNLEHMLKAEEFNNNRLGGQTSQEDFDKLLLGKIDVKKMLAISDGETGNEDNP